MDIQLKSWENRPGMHIPGELLAAAGFRSEDRLNPKAAPVIKKRFIHQTLAERAEKYGGELTLTEEVDWGDPVRQ